MPQFDVTDQVSALTDSIIDTFRRLFNDTVMGDKVTSYIGDIAYSWELILICTLTACVLAYIYLLLIQYVGAIIIWLTIILLQVTLIASGLYVYSQHDKYEEGSDYRDWMKYGAYTIWGIAALYFLCICCCWNAIRIGVACYTTAADYISRNLRIYLVPVITYLIAGLWLAVWLVSAIYVFSIGTPEPRENYEFITEIKWEGNTRNILWFQLFMLFWINAFIMGMCQFIIAASACIWYFEVNSDTEGKGSISRGLWWGFRYHMGSIAFGAAVIAICQMIRAIFEYYKRKILAANDNACVRFMLCYTSYLLWALEKCIKFITKNAYIQVALRNCWFCTGAWNAFALILKNAGRFGWLNSIGWILNWFGVCFVSFLNAFGAYLVLTNLEMYETNVTQPIAPAIIVVLVSYVIVKSFLSIFSFSLDAILQCFLLDESMGFEGNCRPDGMSKFKSTLETRHSGKSVSEDRRESDSGPKANSVQ